MRAKAIATFLAATAALVLLALPAGAGAARTEHQPAMFSAYAGGRATHGFNFVLLNIGGVLVFGLEKELKDDGSENVSYYSVSHPLPGLARGRLDVKLGNRGHLRGRFVATSTESRKPEEGCTGEPTKNEEGHFVGSFVFHGEGGYTTVQASRLAGVISRRGATDCQVPAPASGGHRHQGKRVEETAEKAAERDEVRLLAGNPSAALVLQATREQAPPEPDGPADSSFEVTAQSGHLGPFKVTRSVLVAAVGQEAAASFSVPNLAEPLAEVTLEPPAPFSGSATFHLDGPKTASWTGDLAVELPGLAKLPLTGKKIQAGVCKGHSNCTHTLPKLPQTLLEFGSFGSSGNDGSFFVGGESSS